MKKTISGHYGTTYSLAHNNRDFLPDNVDMARLHNNYYAIAAGKELSEEIPQVKDLQTLWKDYREISALYWENYHIEREELQARIRRLREQYYRQRWELTGEPSSLLEALLELLFLPLTLAAQAALRLEYQKEMEALEAEKLNLWVEKTIFTNDRLALRDALLQHDRETGTKLVGYMEHLLPQAENALWQYVQKPPRAATLEEIYDKVFEPGFRDFQAKQRKCRRYEGTYLEQIRDRQHTESRKKARHEPSHTMAEAIEVLFTIGNKDNTGYEAAPEDAAKAEPLLRDFCDHLVSDGHMCIVTTKELEDPDWKPPFNHGLLLLNLTAHFDEDTPGIHLTLIPYSRGCKRGPDAQPSLGRTMAGMGYPSTWKTKLDEHGNPVPKIDRSGNILYNKDGTVRVMKESDGRGIVDWIEEQKQWIEKEMKRRYDWDREYLGSNGRKHLSTPDYQVHRAKERLQEAELALRQIMRDYYTKTLEMTQHFQQTVDQVLPHLPKENVIFTYLESCSPERLEELYNEALAGIDTHNSELKQNTLNAFLTLLNDAERRRKAQAEAAGTHTQNRKPQLHREIE